MEVITHTYTNVLILLLILYIYYSGRKKLNGNKRIHTIFLQLLWSMIGILGLEITFCIINTIQSNAFIPINKILNVMFFSVLTLLFYQWTVFVEVWVRGKNEISTMLKWSKIGIIINTAIAISSIYNGFYFVVESQNKYSRGEGITIHIAINFIYILLSIWLIYQNRKRISKREKMYLYGFVGIPVVFSIFEFSIPNVRLIVISLSLCLIWIYLYLQQRMIQFDTLTGVLTRYALERYIENTLVKQQSDYGIIFIDIDEFKSINDTYGHKEGDKALREIGKILRLCFGEKHVIARYGGDEFVIILHNVEAREVERSIEQMNHIFRVYNDSSELPYKIGCSYGYDLFNLEKYHSLTEFLHHIDKKMYMQKRKKKMEAKT